MDLRNGGITEKLRKYFDVGICPLDLGTQQTGRPMARQLFALARLLLHTVALSNWCGDSLCKLKHEAKPSELGEESLSHLTFYIFQEAQGNFLGFWSPRVTPLIHEHCRKCLKTAFVWSSIRDQMRSLEMEAVPHCSDTTILLMT